MRETIALVVAIAVSVGSCSTLMPARKARCADGWGSPSIGRQGACSHHGGVRRNSGIRFLVGLGGLGAGITAGMMALTIGRRRTDKPTEGLGQFTRAPAQIEEPTQARHHPLCELAAFQDEIEHEEMDDSALEDEGGGEFKCPECGSGQGTDGPLYNRIPIPGDIWSNVLSTCICQQCAAEIPSHLAERWNGISEREAKRRWSRYRRSGPNRGRPYKVSPAPAAPKSLPKASEATRPYRAHKIDAMEHAYAKQVGDQLVLEQLAIELSYRNGPRARELLRRVKAELGVQ